MDELQLLGTLLTEPGPSREAFDRSRHRLQKTMRGPVRKRRAAWLAGGLGLTVAAAATVLIVSHASTPATNPGTAPPAPPMSGRQVMLAAATTAESKPAATGTYWHVKTTFDTPGRGRETRETWTRRDGRTYLSDVPGMASDVGRRSLVDFTDLDYNKIQRLPTDPEKLKAELLKSSELQGSKQLNTINLLQSMVSDAPAPPKVRAAAFRALAALPHIQNLGRTEGGYRLLISYMSSTGKRVDGTEKIVVDPKTAGFRVEGWAGFGDGSLPVGPGTVTAGWTNELPKIVPWEKQVPYLDPPSSRE